MVLIMADISAIGPKGLSSSGEYYSSIDRSIGADFKKCRHPRGNRRVMSWNVNAGKPRQAQPEHKRSRKTQTGQTPKQRNKRTALRENVPPDLVRCFYKIINYLITCGIIYKTGHRGCLHHAYHGMYATPSGGGFIDYCFVYSRYIPGRHGVTTTCMHRMHYTFITLQFLFKYGFTGIIR